MCNIDTINPQYSTMNKTIEIIKKQRIMLVKDVKTFSQAQLNTVPTGFNNNIIWNLGHMIASQQGLCYKRAGIDIVIDEALFNLYKGGTRPESPIDHAELDKMTDILVSTIDQLEADYNAGKFTSYTAFTTHAGIEISSIDDVLKFLAFHDGLHAGIIRAMEHVLA